MKQGVFEKARKWLKPNDKKGEESHPSAVHICMEAGGDAHYSKGMARISQMEGRIQRQCGRARRDLHKLRQERATEAQAESAIEPETELAQPRPWFEHVQNTLDNQPAPPYPNLERVQKRAEERTSCTCSSDIPSR